MKERELDSYFYTGSLNHKATSSLPGQPGSDFHYYQKFYKSQTQDYPFEQFKTPRFFTYTKSQLQPCKKNTYTPRITSGTQHEAQEL